MNRRQAPAPPRQPPQRQPTPQQKQLQQQQQQQQQQKAPQYNPNVSRQLPAQVTIPQAISILVSRINQLEDKCGVDTNVVVDTSDNEKMEDMTKRIVKLELELMSAKDIIMKLQTLAIDNVTARQVTESTEL
jgi:hemolysin activation/secretion protein